MAQIILVTGANRGIGLALTRELLSLGHHVIAAARDPDAAEELQKLKKESPDTLRPVALDIASEKSVSELESALAGVTSIDALVNNAGLFPEEGDESIGTIDLAHFQSAFETNVVGTARITRALLPLLERGDCPRIVNISSGAGSISDKTDHAYYAYSTSKAALNMFTRALAAELQPRGICVVAMTPGWVKTRMGGDNAPLSPEESARAIAKTVLDLTLEKTSLFLERDGRECRYGW